MPLRSTRAILVAASLSLLLPATVCSAAPPSSHKSHHASPDAHPAMSPERATQIQTALIKNGYLTGVPTGKWDSASISAMQKLQSDNGWQTKIVPDSRALIKLGLGPQDNASASQ